MSELKVNSIKGTSATSAAITIDPSNGTCAVPSIPGRNLVINGAMNVAQRGVTSTSDGIHTVDRFSCSYGGEDEAPTQEQVNVTAGTTPYTLGLRKAFKITNGNNTGGAGVSDYQRIIYNFESQDIACSGWNFKSSSSYLTLSYWIKASVAQNYYVSFKASDSSTSQGYVMETGSLTAGTWTKVTHKIPGDTDLEFDNDNGSGLTLYWWMMRGTNNTGTRALNTWDDFATATITPDQTTTFWTTNDATLELTGVQLEVNSVATDFDFRPYDDELRRCQRYYQQLGGESTHDYFFTGTADGTTTIVGAYPFPVKMRTTPSYSYSAFADIQLYDLGGGADRGAATGSALIATVSSTNWAYVTFTGMSATTAGVTHLIRGDNTANARIKFSAEL